MSSSLYRDFLLHTAPAARGDRLQVHTTMSFPVAEAQLVALFMEAVTYGIYVVTFALCARALFWDRQGLKNRRAINWPMVVVMVLMSIFATLDVALGLRHNLDAFIFYTGPGGAAAEFDNISYWVNVMKVRTHYVTSTTH